MPLINLAPAASITGAAIPQAQFATVEQPATAQQVAAVNANPMILASDIHNISNQNQTLLESFTESVSNIPKFIASSLISGANQLYNIAPSLGNAFGGDYELSDTAEVVSAIDDDLGKYYKEHNESADTLGFILSSIVPGLGGMRVLNAGQKVLRTALAEGRFGNTTSKALNLLVTKRDENLKSAIKSVVNTNNPFSLTEKNLLKTIGSGVTQNILEAAAFETAVAATMFDSPVLNEQDLGDLVSNIAFGGVVFGAVGGVIDGTRAAFAVKKAIKAADVEAMPWTHIIEPPKEFAASDRLLTYNEQIHSMPAVPATFNTERSAFLTAAGNKKAEVLRQRVRKEFTELADGDQVIAQQLFDRSQITGAKAVMEDYLGAKSVSRLAEVTATEKKFNKIKQLIREGKGAKIKAAELDDFMTTEVTYTREYGEEAGAITVDNPPVAMKLVDTLRKGETITVAKGKVHAGKKLVGKFEDISEVKLDRWDLTHSSVMEADARNLWAREQSAFKEGQSIYQYDLPLLEKAYREFDKHGRTFRIHEAQNTGVRSFSSSDDLLVYIKETKDTLANQLNNNSVGGQFYSNPDAMAQKLASLTGIHFDAVGSAIMGRTAVGDHIAMAAGTTRIRINRDYLSKLPVHKLIDTLKHEEGHSIFDVLLSVGGIPTSKRATIQAEMEAVSRLQRPKSWAKAEKSGNFRYLRHSKRDIKDVRADHELAADTFAYLSKFPKKAKQLAPEFEAEFGHLLRPLGEDVVKKYVKQSHMLTQEEIASMLNVRNSYLSGELRAELTDDLFAMSSYADDYTKRLVDSGALAEGAERVPVWKLPQHTKILSDTTPVKDLDGNVLEGIAVIKQRQSEYVGNVNRAVVDVIGVEDYARLADISSADIQTVSRLGAERSAVAAASANYGTVAAKVAYIGNVTNGIKQKFMDKAREVMEPSLYKLTQDTESAIEVANLMATLRAIPDNYALNEAGDALIPSVIKRYEELLAAGGKPKAPVLNMADAPLEIPIKTATAREFTKLHIEQNGKMRSQMQRIRTAQGVEHIADTEVFYPIPVNQKDYPFFATVTDETLTGGSKTRTIYANTDRELADMIAKLNKEPGLVIRTKGEAEAYWKSVGQFDYEKTVHDNRFDVMLKRKGVSSPYFVPTDPQKIANDILSWHTDRANSLAMESVAAKYELPFSELRSMGETYTNIAASKVGSVSILKHADEVVKNPFMDMVKTALDVKNYTDYPFWVSANRLLDNKVSQMYSRLTQTVEGSATDAALVETNRILKEYGYKGATYTEGMELLANHTAPRGVLSNFIQKSNAILATVVLRLDVLNAVNNTVGANVLLGAESKAVMRAIERGDAAAVGELAGLAKILVPGTNKQMVSTKKLIANAIKKFGTDTPEMQFYRDNRFVTSITDQYKWTLDQLTLGGKETVKELNSKISTVHNSLVDFANKGERWTGNKLAEEFNRFVAADVMKQLTDVAVKHKLMDSKTALSYINTFVNRTQGNYLASQRPMMFQGPIGQAIGLFQTYQFNLMQQLLRHVGEGRSKDYMTLLGLQGTIYGMNGMPAFNAINTHVIGTASGNKEHRDAYDLVYGAAGKAAGDWAMYGVASNILMHPDAKLNLYVRGDINPRHVTIVPTNPADIPIYGAATKFFGNLFNTADKLIAGGDVSQTLLQGLEHNGISRPLAGLAQTLQGFDNPSHSSYSTSKRGNVIAANDLLSLSNMSRMVGGKPLAEAVAVDAAFRLRTYAAADSKRRNKLGAVIKGTMIAGGIPSQEQVDTFAESYVKIGGKQKEFNKWMLQLYKTANTSQVNELQKKLNSPFSKSMQRLMGGTELGDFTGTRQEIVEERGEI